MGSLVRYYALAAGRLSVEHPFDRLLTFGRIGLPNVHCIKLQCWGRGCVVSTARQWSLERDSHGCIVQRRGSSIAWWVNLARSRIRAAHSAPSQRDLAFGNRGLFSQYGAKFAESAFGNDDPIVECSRNETIAVSRERIEHLIVVCLSVHHVDGPSLRIKLFRS